MSSAIDKRAGDAPTDAAWDEALARLNRLSVDHHTHAYEIDWDAPEHAFDPGDPQMAMPWFDPLADTEWFAAQPPEVRSRIALYRYAACMKVGWHFENILQRGLLTYVMGLPNGHPEFRYLHHEIIEESEHTLMFSEFIARTRFNVRGMPRSLRLLAEAVVVHLSRIFPALFFVFVLGGEDPIDRMQRRQLQQTATTHPLVEKIMRVHVAEEARHLSFARRYLTRKVPEFGFIRRRILAVTTPIVMAVMARIMLYPPADMIAEFRIPRRVVRAAYRSDAGRAHLAESVAKTRMLWRELGLIGPFTRALWEITGLWGHDVDARPVVSPR